jgi:hypothetical protein
MNLRSFLRLAYPHVAGVSILGFLPEGKKKSPLPESEKKTSLLETAAILEELQLSAYPPFVGVV